MGKGTGLGRVPGGIANVLPSGLGARVKTAGAGTDGRRRGEGMVASRRDSRFSGHGSNAGHSSGVAQGQRSLNRCSGRDFQHEVFAPSGIVPNYPIGRLTVRAALRGPQCLLTRSVSEGLFPFCRKDLRQSSLTLRVSVERNRRCQGRDAVNPRPWDGAGPCLPRSIQVVPGGERRAFLGCGPIR